MNRHQTTAGRATPLRRLGRRGTALLAAALLVAGSGGAAFAYWQAASGTQNAVAGADALAQGPTPVATAARQSVTVSWAASATAGGHAASGYTVRRYSTSTGGSPVPAGAGCAGALAALSCTETGVPAGTWYYTVTPLLGNWSGAEGGRGSGVISDGTAPTVSVTSISPPPNAAGYDNVSPVVVTLAAVDEAGGSGVTSLTYTLDGGQPVTLAASTTSVSVAGDGTHTLVYSATDRAGNVSANQSLTLRIDTQAPAAPSLAVPAVVNAANVASVPISGTAEAASTVTVVASDGAGRTASGTATASSTGTWSLPTLNVTNLNDGTLTVNATAQDLAGNNSAPTTVSVTKDTVSAAPVFTTVPAKITGDTVAAVQLAGTAEAGATVALTATGAVSGTATASATANSAGNWSATMNLSALSSGAVTFSARATDVAENVSTVTTATSRIGPKVVSVTLQNGGLAGTADTNDKVVIVFNETMNPSSLCDLWTSPTGPWTQSANSVSVQITRNAGNDLLTLPSTGCTTSGFGSVALGTAYTTGSGGNLTFKGSGQNQPSSVSLGADRKTLTITLGALKSGVPGTGAGASIPAYQPATTGTPTDTAGVPLGTLPVNGTSTHF
ncbi:beta strand repeat-containing protein [Sinomonas albida]|uniref:beta strand repeat-containing protein n=1 Tax=Sinomonas albida TaxID=369942 RepID=UPI001457E536|nr:Ig-like domain-containing protein [Sinomonas albida]